MHGKVSLVALPQSTLRLLLLAGTNFSVWVVCCIWQVFILVFFLMFLLLTTSKLKEIERRTNFSGHLIYRLDTLTLNSLN